MPPRLRRRHLLALVAIATPLAPAQQSPDVLFRVDSRLMQVEVRVVDAQGNPVRGLSPSNFQLFEDGARQSLLSADYIEQPRTLQRLTTATPQTPAASPAPAATAQPNQHWVYIAVQAGRTDFRQVLDATDDFLRDGLTERMNVSIAGSAFAADRQQLLALTSLMRKHPRGLAQGPGGAPVPGAIDMLVEQLAELELQREATAGVSPISNPMSNSLMPIDQLIHLNNRMALFQLVALVRQLSAYPGKKTVMLFRGGLRWDTDNDSVADLLLGEAARNRVTFYAMDTRGNDAVMPIADPSIYGNALRKLRSGVLHMERRDRREGSQHGLRTLAESTGGKAVLNSNDYGRAFTDMTSNAGDYYVLSYRPSDAETAGDMRRIRIETEPRGLRLEYRKKYYEEKSFPHMSKGERAVHLYRALEFGQNDATLDLRFRGHFFRDPERRTVFVYAAATHPSQLESHQDGPNREVRYSIAAKAHPAETGAPAYRELARTETFTGQSFDDALANPHAYVQANGVIPIPAGDYTWRVAWRDDLTGRYGRFETPLDVPDLTQPASASSLLVTRRAQPRDADSEPGLLDFGGRSFEAETPREYQAGDTVYALYDLYDVPEPWLAQPPPLRFALLRAEQSVEHTAVSEVFVAESTASIRYLATLDTTGFAPGLYTALALMPDAENRPDPYIYATFEIVP